MTLIDFLTDRLSITTEQIEEALGRQERQGGSFGDQLYAMKLVSEAELLGALNACYGWKTIELTGVNIAHKIIKTLPGDVAWDLKAIPFAEDAENNSIKIACRNPEDNYFLEVIGRFIEERKIELYAAVGKVLEDAIIKYYRKDEDSETQPEEKNKPVTALPETKTTAENEIEDSDKKIAYIISPQWEVDRYLGSALVQEGYKVIMATSPAEVIEEMDNRQPDIVLIRKANYGSDQPLLSRILQLTRSGTVRQYNSAAELLDTSPNAEENATYLFANLHLFTAALAKGLDITPINAVKIGPLVERLCRRMNLEPYDRMITVITGYLQDVTALCFKGNASIDRETAFFMLQAAAGDALVYPPSVLNTIRKLYPKLSELSATERQTADIRNGNIVTAVDFYLRHFREDDKLLLKQYNSVEMYLRAQVGSLLLPEVTDAFLDLLQEEIVRPNQTDTPSQSLILDELNIAESGLSDCLKSCGYDSTVVKNIDQFISRYYKIKPDLLVVSTNSALERVRPLLQQMAAKGIVLSKIPSFVLHTSDNHEDICDLLKLGLHDVICVNRSYDVLKLRLQRISIDREQESRQRLSVLQDMGTHGSLDHMNVIDLLQAMGPSNKTLCINVTAKSKHLMLYLNKGQLLYAQCEEKTGAAAVYEALSWERGIWSVDHISPSELPKSNVHRSIDSILIEGCHLLDELNRKNSSANETPAS